MKSFFRITCNLLFFISLLIVVSNCSSGNKPEQLQEKTGWEFYSQRAEIAPHHWVESDIRYDGEPTLALSGEGKEYANGSWSKTIDVTSEAYYEFVTHFKTENVRQLDRSVMAQVEWLGVDGKRKGFLEFPGFRAQQIDDEWYEIRQVYQVPLEAVKAKTDLIFRWDAMGSVYFGETTIKEIPPPAPRPVRLATIFHRPEDTSSPLENLNQFKKYIDIAGEQKADIVCLPEGITVVGIEKSYLEVAESVPGLTTDFLSALAKEHHMYIVAGLYEREGPVVYNTAVLLGRDGTIQGKYRKTSLPTGEILSGLTPGDSFPVFETDFGKIGIMICWDVFFPEPARMLAYNGAEIIFLPIWGGDLTLAKARAIENQVYLVSSSYDMKTGVFDKTGHLLVDANEENPVVMTEVDLNKRKLWVGDGEFRNKIFREITSSKSIKY